MKLQTAPTLEERKKNLSRHTEHWLALDFESISAALDVELNSDLSPLIVRKVIQKRIAEMTSEEKHEIPRFIWEFIDALLPKQGKAETVEPVEEKTSDFNFSVNRVKPSVVDLVLQGGTKAKEFLDQVKDTPNWQSWKEASEVSVKTKDNIVRVKSDSLCSYDDDSCHMLFTFLVKPE